MGGGESATLLTSVRGVGSQGRLLPQKLERWKGICSNHNVPEKGPDNRNLPQDQRKRGIACPAAGELLESQNG